MGIRWLYKIKWETQLKCITEFHNKLWINSWNNKKFKKCYYKIYIGIIKQSKNLRQWIVLIKRTIT